MTSGIRAIALYEPVWANTKGERHKGFDEDVATLAVSAASLIPRETLDQVERVVLVTNQPDLLVGPTASVVLTALRLDKNLPFDERIGGAPAALQTFGSGPSDTLVIAVDGGSPSSSAAVLTGIGAELSPPRTERFTLPVASRWTKENSDRVYDDVRLLRERGWSRSIAGTGAHKEAFVAGLGPKDAVRFSSQQIAFPTTGAASALFALNAALVNGGGEVVAVENGLATALRVGSGSVDIKFERRETLQAPSTWDPKSPAGIALSLPAYERNFEAKVGFIAVRCPNDHVMYPPRVRCSECGAMDPLEPVQLAYQGSVYSVVTVHTPVPGKTTPYSLAVVDVEQSGVRVLVHVTDAQPGETNIGDRGRFVLRRLAVRQGVPDYGMAFQPEETP